MTAVTKPRKKAAIFRAIPRKRASDCQSEPGKVYHLGRHRLLCGDSQDRHMIEVLFAEDERRVALCTDPPYSSGARQESMRRNSTSIGKDAACTGRAFQINRDNLPTAAYQFMLGQVIFAAARGKGLVVEANVFCDARQYQATCDVIEAMGLPVVAQLVWDKLTPGLGKSWRKRHELVVYAAHEDVPDFGFQAGRPGCTEGDVLRVKRDRAWSKYHPTPKPVELLLKLMKNTDAALFYDPFAGSGSTMIAAETLGRTAYLTELDPHFCDLIRWRWALYVKAAAEKGKVLDLGDGLAEFTPKVIAEEEDEAETA